jgi:sugar/nucleoside kinase (ribokinase family)
MFVAVGPIIVDDIVTGDGRALPGILGGAATHAAAGMRVWAKDVGLIGSVGDNFPAGLWTALQQMGFDLRSVHQFPHTTPRAWQIYDAHEHRTEILQSPRGEFPTFAPTPDQVTAYPDTQAFHVMITELDGAAPVFAAMHTVPGALILWEPAPWHLVTDQRTRVLDLIGSVDIVCPNAEECTAMLGPEPPDRWISTFLEAGAKLVAIRMGREGSKILLRGTWRPSRWDHLWTSRARATPTAAGCWSATIARTARLRPASTAQSPRPSPFNISGSPPFLTRSKRKPAGFWQRTCDFTCTPAARQRTG